MDFNTGLTPDSQFNAIFVCIDKLIKLFCLVPCAAGGGKFSVKEIVRFFLDNIVQFYGIPRQVIHDRNPRFTSLFWKALFDILGIKLLYSSAYHPQIDGWSEQMSNMVEQILRTIATDITAKWVSKLSFIEFEINFSVSILRGKTLFKLVYGQQVRNIIDQFDGLYHAEGTQQMVDIISKFVKEAKLKLVLV